MILSHILIDYRHSTQNHGPTCMSIDQCHLFEVSYLFWFLFRLFFFTNCSTDDKLNAAPNTTKKNIPYLYWIPEYISSLCERWRCSKFHTWFCSNYLYTSAQQTHTWATRPAFQLTARRQVPIPPGAEILRAKNDEFTFLANHFWSKSWQQSFFLLDFIFLSFDSFWLLQFSV